MLGYTISMNFRSQQSSGFIKLILIVVVALIVLGFFGFDVRNIIESEQVQQNLAYVWDLTKAAVHQIWIWILFVINGAWIQAKELFELLKGTL